MVVGDGALLEGHEVLVVEGVRAAAADDVDAADGLRGQVLIIGFGRFAQVVAQPLLARDVDVSIIENDVEMIQAASQFGFKVYYGDGTQLHTLRASGAEEDEMVLVCVDKPELTDRIVELVKSEFPTTRIMARAFDRGHSMRLIQAGVDYQIRETFESAHRFGETALRLLGVDADEAAQIGDTFRALFQATYGGDRLDSLDILGAVAGVAAVTFMYWRAVRPTTTPPALTDPPPPVTMFVLDGAGDHHGPAVEDGGPRVITALTHQGRAQTPGRRPDHRVGRDTQRGGLGVGAGVPPTSPDLRRAPPGLEISHESHANESALR